VWLVYTHDVLSLPQELLKMSYPQAPYQQPVLQPTPPPTKSNKVLWIILGLVIGIPTILLGGCVACVALLSVTSNSNLANGNRTGGANNSSTSSGSTSAAGRAEIDGMKIYQTGEAANVGYMQYTVLSSWYSTRLSSNEYLDEPPDATYLFVDLAVANLDKEQRTIPPFKLIDANKAEYGTSDRAWAAEGSIGLLTSLNPSVSKRAYVIFDVPQGRTYKLKISGGYWSSEDALIELSPITKRK
jgi:hypothetical protein